MRPSLACSVAPPRCIALAPTLCNITDVNFQSLVGSLWSVLCSTDELHRELAEPHGASALARLPKHCRFHEGSATKASPDARADRDVKLPSFNRAALARHASKCRAQHLGEMMLNKYVASWRFQAVVRARPQGTSPTVARAADQPEAVGVASNADAQAASPTYDDPAHVSTAAIPRTAS